MTDWKKLVGKRVLLRAMLGRVREAKILELSPSGKCIKVKWLPSGREEWLEVDYFNFGNRLIEVLD